MINAKKIATLFVLLLIGTSTTILAQASPQMEPKQAKTTDISDKDLEMFADAYMSLQMANQQSQAKMMKMIEDKGMDVQRFQEIQQASTNPEEKSDATPEELELHKELIAEFQGMQPELQKNVEKAIAATGLSLDRYQEVASAIQNDEALQQKLQQIIMKKNTEG